MKVIALSLDKKIFNPQSSVAQRAVFFGTNLEKYIILVPVANKKIELSSKVLVIGLAGLNKIHSLYNTKKRLSTLLKNEHFDLLTIQDSSFLAFLGLRVARKFKVKTEVQVHGFEKNAWFREYFTRQSLVKADLVRVVSQRLKDDLIKKYSISPDKIYIAPVVLNTSQLLNTKVLNLRKIYSGNFIFLTVSRLVPVKNIALQLRAIKELADRQKVKLVIVGDGPEKDNLKKLANDLNIREQVIFFGWQDKIGDLYHSADCLLLTSSSEGYALVAVEARNCGLPVIMTDVGCAGEAIKDNVHGLIIPVNDQAALVKAMEKMRQTEFCNSIKNKLAQEKKIDNQESFDIILNQWQALKKNY